MPLPDGWTTDTVEANGVTITYHRTGEGPPILAAHGFYDDGRRWIPLGERLADAYTVVAYDARGLGRSDAPTAGYRPADRVADLRGVARALDLSNPILLGHSMGGATVAWAAAREPAFPRAVVLADPEAFTDTPSVDADERAAAAREGVLDADEWSIDAVVAELDADVSDAQARRLAEARLLTSAEVTAVARHGYPAPVAESLPDVRAPTLVLRSDRPVEERLVDHAAVEGTDARLVHVGGTGHYVFRDAPDAATRELRTFLRRTLDVSDS